MQTQCVGVDDKQPAVTLLCLTSVNLLTSTKQSQVIVSTGAFDTD